MKMPTSDDDTTDIDRPAPATPGAATAIGKPRRDAPVPAAVPATAPASGAAKIAKPDRGRGAQPALKFNRDKLLQAHFHTEGLVETEARLAYVDRFDGIIDTIFLAPFVADLNAYRVGALSILRLTATPRQSVRLASRITYDRYDSISVQYVAAGRARGEAGQGTDARTIVSDPGTILLLDYSQPFVVTDLEPRTVINVAVPRRLFPSRRSDPSAWHGAVLDGSAAALLVGFLRQLGPVLDTLPAAAGSALATAFCHLLTIAIDDYGKMDAVDRDSRTIQRAERLVDDRLGSADLGPAWLAAKLNLSRSELYAVMERFGGVARFILHRRLLNARAALENAADERRIGAIAYAYGFSSEAHFSRAFRAAFGATASEIRRAAGRKAE